MRFGVAELTDLADILRTAAQTEIMPRFRRLGADGARQKTGPLDLVTEADEAAERVITAGIARRFAGAVVVGEEAASADPSRLALLADADLAFVVDPVDGTANFAAGLPLFGVMAAAIVRGEVVAAAIHDPICDDMALALRGEGAWTESPGGARTDLRVAAPVPVAEMTGNVSWRYLPEPQRSTVCANLPRLGGSWDYPVRRARIPDGVRRTVPSAVLQPVDAVGPCTRLAAASGGRRLFRSAGRQRLHAAADGWRPDLRA